MWAIQLRRLNRRRLLRRHAGEFPLSDELLRCWDQLPQGAAMDWREQEFLVADIETSSLEVNDGEMLSIGWVVIKAGAVQLSTVQHLLVVNSSEKGVGDSATIHQLRDCELEGGLEAEVVLSQFLQACAGRVLVFHHCELDLAFLDDLSRRLCGAPLLLPVVDTLQLEKRKLTQKNQTLHHGVLTLAGCRRRYSLPDFLAHNALMDAVATAELLMAILAHRGKKVRVKEILF